MFYDITMFSASSSCVLFVYVYQEDGVTKVAELDKMLSPEAGTLMHHVLQEFKKDAR